MPQPWEVALADGPDHGARQAAALQAERAQVRVRAHGQAQPRAPAYREFLEARVRVEERRQVALLDVRDVRFLAHDVADEQGAQGGQPVGHAVRVPDRKLAAPSAAAPDFAFEDARDGYREGVRSRAGRRFVYTRPPDGEERSRAIEVPPGAAIDAGFDARVRELGATGVEARVLNISESGFMAETDGHFEVGSRIWLMLPGRSRANAVVKWVAGEKIGAEFASPISLEGLQ